MVVVKWHLLVRIGEGFFDDTDEFSTVAAWAVPLVPSNQIHMLL